MEKVGELQNIAQQMSESSDKIRNNLCQACMPKFDRRN